MNQFEKAGPIPGPSNDQPIRVGVRKNPDGTLDYSRAATLIDSEGKFAQADKEYKEQKEAEKAQKYKIPEDVKPGSSEIVWYQLRNAIYNNTEAMALAQEQGTPDLEKEKLIADYKTQQKMLEHEDMKFSKSLILNGMEKGEVITAEQAREKTAALTANEMFDLIQSQIEYYEELQDEGEETSSLVGNDRPIKDLIKSARDLQNRLIDEASKSTR